MCYNNLLQGENSSEKTKSAARKREERKYYQWVMRQLARNLNQYKDGISVTLFDGVTRNLLPVYCYSISDWPEGQKLTNIKEGASTSFYNCRTCMTPTAEFGNTQRGLVYPRRVESELELLRKNTRDRKPGTRYPGEVCVRY